MEMLEAGCIGMAQIERQKCISVINCIEFFAFQEVLKIMLNNWALSNCCSLGPGSIDSNAVTESENVFIFFVLESVWVYINYTFSIGNSTSQQLVLWLAWGVDDCRVKFFLNSLSSVSVSEYSNLFSLLVELDLNHFPSKEDINASLVTFFQCYLISIGEFEYFFVGSPVLNSCILGRSSLKLVLSHEVLVI